MILSKNIMDFARKQLEKYGWREGSGLGRNEDGIAEPLRPRLKRSSAGVGHDAAAEFNDHWWSSLYDKAAANVEVNDKTKITTKEDDAFQISSTTWQITKKPTKPARYMDGFVKTAILTSGGARTERVRDEESDEEVEMVKMTDEELFAACGGRTAHKGARHGLRAIGKLARIEEQEKKLLKLPQYKEYSHTKTDLEDEIIKRKKVVQENLSFDKDTNRKNQNKEKKKKCKKNLEVEEFKRNDSEEIKNDNKIENPNADLNDYDERNKEEIMIVNAETEKFKTKKKNEKNKEGTDLQPLELPRINETKSKKNKRRKEITEENHIGDLAGNIESTKNSKNKKNKKKKITEQSEIIQDIESESLTKSVENKQKKKNY